MKHCGNLEIEHIPCKLKRKTANGASSGVLGHVGKFEPGMSETSAPGEIEGGLANCKESLMLFKEPMGYLQLQLFVECCEIRGTFYRLRKARCQF